MLADFYIPMLSNAMKIAVSKNHLRGQILYPESLLKTASVFQCLKMTHKTTFFSFFLDPPKNDFFQKLVFQESQNPTEKGNVGRPKGKAPKPLKLPKLPKKPTEKKKKEKSPKKIRIKVKTEKQKKRNEVEFLKMERPSDDEEITIEDVKREKKKRKLQQEKEKNTKRLKMTDLFGETSVSLSNRKQP